MIIKSLNQSGKDRRLYGERGMQCLFLLPDTGVKTDAGRKVMASSE